MLLLGEDLKLVLLTCPTRMMVVLFHSTNLFVVCWVGNLYQGLDLLMQFEEPLKEYVGIVQNIKVHLESLFFSMWVAMLLPLHGPLKMAFYKYLPSSHTLQKAMCCSMSLPCSFSFLFKVA